MKKFFLVVLLLGQFIFQAFSQQSGNFPQTDTKDYQQMKAAGLLTSGANVISAKEKVASQNDQKEPAGGYKMPTGCNTFITGGTPVLTPMDDGSTSLINLPFTFCFYGTNYNSCYINNNGNISFGSSYSTFSSTPFPDPTHIMIAPFWADVDTRGTGTVLSTMTATHLVVTWQAVGYYDSYTDKVNTFQVILTDGTDPILPLGYNVGFNYLDMQWTTGNASSGVGGFGGTPATVGVNKGDGITYIQIGRFDHAGVNYDGGYGANDGVSWLDNQSFYFNSCSSTNIAPIASGVNNCDTTRICATGDTLILNALFLAPEINQTTNLNINLNGTPDASIVGTTTGTSATGQVQIIGSAANAGMNIITFTAYDNGTPQDSIVINAHVFVDTTNMTPNIIGNLFTCNNNPTTLTINPNPLYTSYSWSNSSSNDSITVLNGTYALTITDVYGCKGTSPSVTVENRTLSISGVQPFCMGESILLTGNPSISTGANYLWSTSATTQSDYVSNSGTYYLTVSYSSGCSVSDSVTVTQYSSPNANFISNPPGSTHLGSLVDFTDISNIAGGTITSWYWDFGDASGSHPISQNPSHLYGENGTFTITLAVESNNGCWDTIQKNYDIISEIEAPNVFTPNNGGITGVNQFFFFKNLEYYPSSTLKIYNRWGKEVYASSDYQNNWTGGNNPDGVYYFILDGPKLKEPIIGFVQILR